MSGTVFRDYNANGTRQATVAYTEPMVPGIIVNAYNASDVLIASYKTTSGTGFPYAAPNYSIPVSGTAYNGTQGSNTGFIGAGVAVRLEFVIPNSGAFLVNNQYDFSGKSGGTSVQFATGGSTNINYGINNPADYVFDPSATFANTFLFLPVQSTGNPLGGGTSGTQNAFVKFPYNRSGATALSASEILATNAQIGTTYGTAYSKKANRIFTTAYMKRHSGFGPANGTPNNAPGAIYIINPALTSTTSAASYFTSLDALGFPTHNYGGGAPAWGNPSSFTLSSTGAAGDTRTETITYTAGGLGVIGGNVTRGLPASATSVSNDPAAYGQVGMVSLGDIEISDDGRYLFISNFYDRKIYQLQLNSITNPTAATYVASWNLPNPPARNTVPGYTGAINGGSYSTSPAQFYDGTRGFQRPFGLKYYQGKLYIGAVTTGENGGVSVEDTNDGTPEYTDLWAYVWELNPSTGFTSTPLLQFPLNFNRGLDPNNLEETWKPWTRTFPASVGGDEWGYAQPMFSGLEFDVDGTLILGFRDRAGDQGGVDQYMMSTTSTVRRLMSNGDQYRAYKNPATGVFELEQNGKEGPSSPKPATAGQNSVADGANSTAGPTNYAGNHGEFYYQDDVSAFSTNYHLNTCQGSITMLKGTNQSTATYMDPNALWSGGISWMNNTDGSNPRDYEIYAGSSVGNIGKANGLGDIEILMQDPPTEIGNRVWNDVNGNGIQNAGEAAIANVTIELYSNGPDGIPGNGDDVLLGTTTTNASGEWYFNTANVTDGDPNTAGNQAGPQPNFNYNIRIGSADWTGGAGVGDLAGLQVTRTDKIGNGAVDLSDNDAALNSSNIPMITVVTGDAGNNNHNLDFGFKALASLGDKVWKDDDKDGVQDAGEPGVAGVTVTLYNNSGTAIAVTTTDAYGNYLFDNLTPGNYTVGFTLPANYSFISSAGTSEADATNSDADAVTGRTTTVTLSAAENQRNIDAGLIFSQPATNSIGDRVWFDNGAGGGTAGDGIQNGNEPGVSGVTITLYDNGGNPVATAVTDANGNYIFAGLPSNTNYSVGITPPIGMQLITGTATSVGNTTTNSDFSQTTFRTSTFSSGPAGTQITGIDAGLAGQPAAAASIGDKVWNDLNNNGIQDAGEPGIPGVTVNLYRDANGDGLINGAEASTPYLTTVTNAFGNYIFNGLPAVAGGTMYQVGFVLPGGYNFVTPNTGASDFLDSDANTLPGGLTGLYKIVQGQRNVGIDAGLVQTAPAGTGVIGDKVWFDANQDGVQDVTETGVPGITATLYNSGGTAIAATVTDKEGNYYFANLPAGNYSVGFSNLPQGYSFASSAGTTSASGSTNSDVNVGNGQTAQFALGAGQNLSGLDAGLIAGVSSGLGSIGNKVWWDLDNDNIQDAGEPGVQNATVNLDYDLNGDGDFSDAGEAGYRITTTNGLGDYQFTGLPAGNYQVRFSGLPAGATAVTQNSGTDDAVDSDGGAISAGTSTTSIYTLASGEDNLTIDLGIRNTAKGSFGNRVWIDNGAGGGIAADGIQNGSEAGVAGIMVTLVNSNAQPVDRAGTVTTDPITTVTDANGYYAFADLTAGISFAASFSNLPPGFDFTSKAGTGGADDNRSDADLTSGLTPVVTIVANTYDITLDAGISSARAALGNFVWMDTNGNGTQDAGEPGIPGVTVTLYRPGFGLDGIAGNGDDAQSVASMITDQNGNYLFSNLLPGTYEMEYSTIPGGAVFTQHNTSGDNGDDTNSDAVPQTGTPLVARTTGITLTAGEAEVTIDAGLFIPRAVIGNYVWSDLNSDGVQNSNESGAPGIMVSLIDGGGNTVAVAVTDANGGYLFPNVAPGNYTLSFINLPSGTSFTTPNQTGFGGDDNTDSDVTGTTITGIVVTTTTVNISFDAGILGLTVLPVKMQFTAVKAGSNVQLTCLILSESGIEKYEMEHSVDGIIFSSIADYIADGRSVYEKLHTHPAAGLNYYRVKAVNLDGKIEYSEIRIVIFNDKNIITIFPNPVSDIVNIQLPESWQGKSIQVDLINQIGQVVLRVSKTQAGRTETLRVDQLAAGIYHIRLQNNAGMIETRKLQVQ